MEQQTRKARGFAAMTPERRRQIAQQGGLAASALGKGHRFTPEKAQAAGRKGGRILSADREHMAEIGRRGGKWSAEVRQQRKGLAPRRMTVAA